MQAARACKRRQSPLVRRCRALCTLWSPSRRDWLCGWCLHRRDKLLVAAGVSAGFCVRDLVKPDARRTRRNLSAIIK